MKAMILERTGPLDKQPEPLRLVDLPDPEPASEELLLRVLACGVCHTELDEIEGRLTPPQLPVVPGHEIIGQVLAKGDAVKDFQRGDRVGVGWIFRSSGDEQENLSPQ